MKPDHAPITQLMLTVQFMPAIYLNPLQVADAFNLFRDDYPIFEQVNRAGPMPIQMNVHEPVIQMGGGPRNALSSADRQWVMFFQEDRMSFGWQRTVPLNEPSNYPGFSATLARALGVWDTLRAKVMESAYGPVEPLIGEVSYVDVFEIGGEHDCDRLSSIFQFINPSFQASMSSYGYHWTEPLDDNGFMQIGITGPQPSSEDRAASALQTTARFQIEGGWAGVEAGLNKAHDSIDGSFKRLINPNYRPM